MEYKNFSREQLLDRIESLEMLNQELLKEKVQETKLEYAWTGNLGHWYWNVKANEVTFNPLKVTALGYDESGKPSFVAGIVFDITEKKKTQMELECKNRILSEMSSIDGLTKISNHRTLMERLDSEMAESSRTNSPLSIAIFDIDDFKKVNDSKGHVYGDQVLVDVASIMKKNIRGTDLAGRYGGEEFMVIFPDTNISLAKKISKRIRQAVENYNFVDGLRITISGGVDQYNNETITDIIHSADTKLYAAKKNGKNQIVSDM